MFVTAPVAKERLEFKHIQKMKTMNEDTIESVYDTYEFAHNF